MERLFDLETRKFYHIGRDGSKKALLSPIKGHNKGSHRVGLIADPMTRETYQLDREDLTEEVSSIRQLSIWRESVVVKTTTRFSYENLVWECQECISVPREEWTKDEIIILNSRMKEQAAHKAAEIAKAAAVKEAAAAIKLTGRIASIMSKPGYRWALLQHVMDTKKVSLEVATIFVTEHAQKALLKWQEDKAAKAALYRK